MKYSISSIKMYSKCIETKHYTISRNHNLYIKKYDFNKILHFYLTNTSTIERKQILIVTFNTKNTCLTQLRKISSWKVVSSNADQISTILANKHIDLICIETDKIYQKSLELLKNVKNKRLNIKTLAIIPNKKKIKRIYLSYGCDDYLCMPYNCEDLILRVKKLLNYLPINYRLIYQSNYLRYECKFNKIMYKNTYIPLTPTELLIVKLLIQNSIITKNEIQNYLNAKLNKKYSKNYTTVLIHRAKKKIKLCTGREVIKNKYGCGYYIV